MNLTSVIKCAKVYTLSDGSKAYYHDISKVSNPHRIYFYFKKNGLNYVISLHPNVSEQITTDVLVEMADSIG